MTKPNSYKRERKIWYGMVSRCTRPQDTNYHKYGAKGISVCDRWLSFDNFFKDMGYSNGLTLDRIKSNEGYSPENCRWTTYGEQNRNRLSYNELKLKYIRKVSRSKPFRVCITGMKSKSFSTLHSAIEYRNKLLKENNMITEIKFGITKNLGDYNSERIDATYMVAEGENPNTAMVKLKSFVKNGAMEVEPERQITQGPDTTTKTTTEEKVEEDIQSASEPAEKPAKTTKKAPAKKAASKKATKKATKKDEPIKYDRENKDHKKKMAAVLNEHFPTWKKDAELGALAKELSGKLVGTPIFDKKGNLLDSFVEAVKDGMATEDEEL